ncbi:MAG: NAD(P)/FAD-dependent oxidoreductase [Eubacterium sp.]|nr:NAD(P)/FAD-dependent oxidoreductase [Eubacterium sp.]
MYDVIVIGGGVTGTCIARELSRYDINLCLLEKGDDVASGTSKANSGVIHSGFDCKPGTLMAKLNVRGNELMYKYSKELDFPTKMNGSLVVCTVEAERGKLDVLLDQGIKNGVPGVRIVERDELLEMEPNLTPNAVAALYAPTGGVICPFNLAIAMGENAAVNGCEFKFETKVTGIVKKDDHYEVETSKGTFESKIVVNAAGVYADELHNMVSENKIKIIARKGEYLLLDKELGNYFTKTVFTLPGKMGKGVLTAPTIHGNLYVGPTATDVEDKESTNTTQEILDDLVYKAQHSHLTKDVLPMNKVITSFSGLRAHWENHEFIVEEVADSPGFFDAAGIESPGLTSSPAIGEMMAGLIEDKYHFPKKENFIDTRKGVVRTEGLSIEERNELIKKNPQYGQIVCRCEMITEAEIVDAINRPIGATSLDGIKRRTRQGTGRCQAGFCTPKTMEILSRETGIPMEQITKKGTGSNMLTGKIKEN